MNKKIIQFVVFLVAVFSSWTVMSSTLTVNSDILTDVLSTSETNQTFEASEPADLKDYPRQMPGINTGHARAPDMFSNKARNGWSLNKYFTRFIEDQNKTSILIGGEIDYMNNLQFMVDIEQDELGTLQYAFAPSSKYIQLLGKNDLLEKAKSLTDNAQDNAESYDTSSIEDVKYIITNENTGVLKARLSYAGLVVSRNIPGTGMINLASFPASLPKAVGRTLIGSSGYVFVPLPMQVEVALGVKNKGGSSSWGAGIMAGILGPGTALIQGGGSSVDGSAQPDPEITRMYVVLIQDPDAEVLNIDMSNYLDKNFKKKDSENDSYTKEDVDDRLNRVFKQVMKKYKKLV